MIPKQLQASDNIAADQTNQELAAVISELDMTTVRQKDERDRKAHLQSLQGMVSKARHLEELMFYLKTFKRDRAQLSHSQQQRLDRIQRDPLLCQYLRQL